MARLVAFVSAIVMFFVFAPASASVARSEAPPQMSSGAAFELDAAEQADAEALFAEAEAAVWFPELRQVRALRVERNESTAARRERIRDFTDSLERDFPGFRSDRFGPYLLKTPMRSTALPSPAGDAIVSDATTFTDGFEGSIANWTLANNTGGEYNFTVMGCKAHGGQWSADATRGGSKGQHLTCWDGYPAGVTTQITHAACDGIQGASQAWLDFWFTTDVDASEALGVYYEHTDGYIYGYGFTGTWSGWFHIILNLSQWNTLGNLTALSCPKVIFQFRSDATGTAGTGAFIDDVSIRTDPPSALRASITANPIRGAAPLTVSFAGNVSGGSGGETYEWRFGDAASSTATSKTPSFTYSTAGEYWARFRVSDSSGARAYAHVKIVAESGGSSCSVSCSASAAGSAAVGTAVSFQASATASGCSGSTSYLWNFGDGQTSSLQNPSHAYSAAGTYSWTMTAGAGGTNCTRSGAISITAASSRLTKRRSVQPPKEVTLGSQTIGAAGGSVGGGGVTITVPSGAFGGSTSVAITRGSSAVGSGDLSPVYSVQGLPSTLNADLTLSIDLDTAPSGLGAGEAVFVSFTGAGMTRDLDVRTVPFLIPATVSGRNVRATLPKSSGSAMFASTTPGRIESQAYTGDFKREMKVTKRTTLSNDHFNLYFASNYESWAQETLRILEQAYQRIGALGFHWGCRQSGGTFNKIPVYMRSLGTGETDPYGSQISRLDGCGGGWVFTDYIEVNTDYSPFSDAMRAALAHELLHQNQETYLPTTLTNPSRGLSMAEASATWFETVFVAGSCPGVMTGSYQFPWRGLMNFSGSAVEGSGRRKMQNHGYGMAALLKYHADQSSVQNDSFVSSIWSSMKNGSSELEALQNAVGSSVGTYWAQFARDYYSGTAGCSTYQNTAQRVAMKDAASLAQTFKFSAYPLSSISHAFDLQKLDLTDKTPLPIMAQGLIDGQTVYVYDVKSKKEIGQITKAAPTFEIADITTYKGSILVMTFVDANLPTGTSATNEVTLTTGSTYKCWATAGVFSHKEPSVNGGYTLCEVKGAGTWCPIFDGAVDDFFIGTVTGDKFHSQEMWCRDQPSWCRWRDDNATYNNSVDFTFTNKGATIEGFFLSFALTNKYGGPSGETLKVSAPVPRVTSSASGFQYKLTGGSVCSAVKSSRPYYDIVCDASSFFQVTCDAYTPPKK